MAVDDQDLYKSEESAIKVASHEFRGSIWLSLTEGLHLPLTCLIDYCGMRITAIAKVPITRYHNIIPSNLPHRDTLVYGSSNAAETIHNEHSPYFREAEALMNRASSVLFWEPHRVLERSTHYQKKVTGPVDLEVKIILLWLTIHARYITAWTEECMLWIQVRLAQIYF